jgi:enoyl-CoA hydratase
MIELKSHGSEAIIKLTPPLGGYTLLDVATLKSIIKTIKEASGSPAKVIRIQGVKGCFAVGADLKTMYDYDALTAKGFSMLGNSLFNLMRSVPQVIIAEIDGYCMGGGMDFAAACDIRLATAESKFAHPGSKLGIITGFGGTQAVPREITPALASEFFFTGEIFTAETMKKGGFLLDFFTDFNEMESYSQKLTSQITSKNRSILSYIKKSLFHKGI